MADPKTCTTEEAFAAGFISIFGAFALVKANGQEAVRYIARTTNRPDVLHKVAEIGHINAWVSDLGEGKTATSIAISGKNLHELMIRVWPELTYERKQEYAGLRKLALASKPATEKAPAKVAKPRPKPREEINIDGIADEDLEVED